jgi:tetratricopeptide (TPR) repeat protein
MIVYLLFFVGVYLTFWLAKKQDNYVEPSAPTGSEVHINRLWNEAVQSIRMNRFIRAEKALLAMLHIDQHNVSAYNRLGVLYARQKNFKDSLSCFEIAYGLEPNASSIHNMGLIYLEVDKYDKAVSAFERAIQLEPKTPSRYLALAKAYDKKGDIKNTIKTLEYIVEIKPDKQVYGLLVQAYESAGMNEKAEEARSRFGRVAHQPSRSPALKQPRKII